MKQVYQVWDRYERTPESKTPNKPLLGYFHSFIDDWKGHFIQVYIPCEQNPKVCSLHSFKSYRLVGEIE